MSSAKLYLCNCLGSQQLDRQALQDLTGLEVSAVHHSLCRADLPAAKKAMLDGEAIIACQQEAHFFEEVANELDVPVPFFIDLRDRAGWTSDEKDISPKMSALIADALLEKPAVKTSDVISEGVCLIVGDPEGAINVANKLKDLLSITVLLEPSTDLSTLISRDYDIVLGNIKSVVGSLGQFEIVVDKFQERIPGGRGEPAFTPPRDDANSQCDIIIDLRKEPAFVSAPEKREGYLRADPTHANSLLDVVLEASQLIGTFEKPLYVSLTKELCAHSGAGKKACNRCLDLCPTGAIKPNGDHVSVDPMICAGCGMCSSVCPSGAISYDAPPVDFIFRRIQNIAEVWKKSSSEPSNLLIHDSNYGLELIQFASRFGKGLPANLVPLQIDALASFGHAECLAALATGFSEILIVTGPETELTGMEFQIDLANKLAGMERVFLIENPNLDQFEMTIWRDFENFILENPILPLGSRRQVTRIAAKALNPDQTIIELPETAPYGTVEVNKETCTLCLSCVSLCPSGALMENPDRPELRFTEDACLQCGLCANICPESAITLKPQMNLSDEALGQRILNEEEPFACIECGALFGVRSTVMKITEKLAGNHSMFANPDAIKMIQMCDNCRVNAAYHSENNPFAMGERPRTRTTDDYLE